MKPAEKFTFLSCLLLSFLLLSPLLHAQESPKTTASEFWHRVSVGGYGGLQVGTVTGIVISPEAKIRIVDQFYAGLGATYEYYWYKNYFFNMKTREWLNYASNVYGGRLFVRYYLRDLFDNFLGNLFAHAEYEYLYTQRPYREDMYGVITDWTGQRFYSQGKQAIGINSLFLGGGYSQPVSNRVFVDILLLFDLNETKDSPYSSPVVRVGFGVNL